MKEENNQITDKENGGAAYRRIPPPDYVAIPVVIKNETRFVKSSQVYLFS
jgi:hypothetical protein